MTAEAPKKARSKKDSTTRDFERAVKRGVDAWGELLSGTADAFAEGARAGAREVTVDNCDQIGFGNGFLRGGVEAAAATLERIPNVLRQSLDLLLAEDG